MIRSLMSSTFKTGKMRSHKTILYILVLIFSKHNKVTRLLFKKSCRCQASFNNIINKCWIVIEYFSNLLCSMMTLMFSACDPGSACVCVWHAVIRTIIHWIYSIMRVKLNTDKWLLLTYSVNIQSSFLYITPPLLRISRRYCIGLATM